MTLFWIGAAWLAGIALGKAIPLAFWQWLLLAAIALLARLFLANRVTFRTIYLGLSFLFLGALRFQLTAESPSEWDIVRLNDTGVRVRILGLVVRTPEETDRTVRLTVRAARVEFVGGEVDRQATGLFVAQASRYEDWGYGDRVEAVGLLETPPQGEDFSYREYLALQGIKSWMPNGAVQRIAARQGSPILQILYDFRLHAFKVVYALFPDPEASLLAGILLGLEGGISPQVRDAFNATGTTHIIAISGFNITLIASLLISLFGRAFGARRGALAAAIGIALYTFLVGADASVVRAAIMAGLALAARHMGRQTDGLASLSAAALLMTLLNPLALWDVGFQLSFASTLGLILYAEPLKVWGGQALDRFLPQKAVKSAAPLVAEYGLFTLAAQLTTIPLVLYHFKRLSLVTLIANPVILPAQPGLLILGGLATLAGSIWLPLGIPLAWIAWPFPAFTIRAVEMFSHWPGASVRTGGVGLPLVVGCYALIFGLTILLRLDRGFAVPRIAAAIPPALAMAGLGISAVLVWRLWAERPDALLHMTMLDVGDGDAVLIESPTGRWVLIDGGPSGLALGEGLGRRLPLLDRSLDWVVVAGNRDDQLGGIAGVIERFPVRGALLAAPPGGYAYQALLAALTEAGSPIVPASAGSRLDLGERAVLEVSAMGLRGALLTVSYGNATLILAPGGDLATWEEWENLSTGHADVVLLSDGGNANANPLSVLGEKRPWVVLASVQAGNARGLPSPETLETLEGTTILRTDLHGWIELTTDGKQMWVEVERAP